MATMTTKKGIVLNFDELHEDMIELVTRSSLNVLGLHNWDSNLRFDSKVDEMIQYMNSKEGLQFLERMQKHNIDVEYEIHALSWLMPRTHYASRPELYRMNEEGERTPDANCCVTNRESIAIIQERSIQLARQLKTTSHRYFFWQDDTKPWCSCTRCRDLSSSDQNLLLMNGIVEALRSIDPQAQLAFLAYMNTLDVVPSAIRPADGIFLEITGPVIHNKEEKALQAAHRNEHFQKLVDAQLAYFGTEGAHVLEYWLDVSLQSNWTRPAVKVAYDENEIRKDIQYYASAGFQSMTTFGVFMDKDYFNAHGEPPIPAYARLLDQG